MEHQNGKLDLNNDLPSIYNIDGTIKWYKDNLRHRNNNLPAIIKSDGLQEWYINNLKKMEKLMHLI